MQHDQIPSASRQPSGRRISAFMFGASFLLASGLSVTGQDIPKVAPKPAAKAVQAPTGRHANPIQAEKINEVLNHAWKANKLRPSDKATNHEFLRRVYLDLIGRIATPAEVRHFEQNTDRVKLVRRLLYEKTKIEGQEFDYAREFANNWANIWTVWLMTRTGEATYREQIHDWLEDHFAKDGTHKEMVEKLLTASGDNESNGAVNYVLKHLGEPTPKGKQADEGFFDVIPITSRTTRLFMGMQTQCVQCHDHPFNPDWKQQSFWGVNVFFRQVSREPLALPRQQGKANVPPKLTLRDDGGRNRDAMIAYEKRTGVMLYSKGTFLDGRKLDLPDGDSRSRRQRLAELVVTSEQFPKAYVNRIWGHLFGRGLNEQASVDDFGEHNKVVHPELLDYLAKEFAAETPEFEFNRSNAFDPKKLLYWLCTSDAYSLSSIPNATNDKPDVDQFFSRMLLKAMTPEQLYESLAKATGVERTSSTEWKKKREEWMKKLVVNFGDDEGNEITFNGTLLQALMMMNGKELNEAIKNTDRGALAEILRKYKTPNRVIDEIYLATLNRHPSPTDNRVLRFRSNDAGFYVDLYWTLLNSSEFILNH